MYQTCQMYKVFLNENCIILSEKPEEGAKNVLYHYTSQIDEAVHYLSTNQNVRVNLYSEDLEELWFDFKNHFKIIEAAGGIVKNSKNEFLFIHRLGRWDLPKGKIEKGEDPETAAIREIEEECSIHGLVLNRFITTTYHIYYQKTYILKLTHWYDVSYIGEEQPKPQTEEGIEKVEWVKESEYEKLLVNSYPNIHLLFEKFYNQNNN